MIAIIGIQCFAFNAFAEQVPDPCPPPPDYQLNGDVSFILRRCADIDSISCPPVGPCVEICNRHEEQLSLGIGYGLLGIIMPDGRVSRWASEPVIDTVLNTDNDGRWYLYDNLTYRAVPQLVTPNGDIIQVTEFGEIQVYSVQKSTVSSVPGDSTQVDAQVETPVTRLPPVVRVSLNGKENLEHQFFTKDQGKFILKIINEEQPSTPAGKPSDPCVFFPAPEPASLVVHLSLEQTESFLQGIQEASWVIEPGKEKVWTVNPTAKLPAIKDYDQDVLYGARIGIQAWSIDAPDTLLVDTYFNAYRYLDAADDKHDDGVVMLARTLGDGPGGVVRKRPLKLATPKRAEVQFQPSNKMFSVIGEKEHGYIAFDPKKFETPKTVWTNIRLQAAVDGRSIGKLKLQGKAEPPNRIKLNQRDLSVLLQRLAILSSDPMRAIKPDNVNMVFPPQDYYVHPALIPPAEAESFNSSAKAESLVEDLKLRLEQRLGDLLPGIEWVSEKYSGEALNIKWELRRNMEDPEITRIRRAAGDITKYRPFVLGKAFDDLKDPNKIDNWEAIRIIINQQEQWNKGELAYRLSEAINPGRVKNITLYPDSMMENHRGFGDNKAILSRTQILNALSKTTLHEVAHSMSLKHPIQSERTPKDDDIQLLQIAPGNDDESFNLSFHGVESETISYAEAPLGKEILGKLLALRTIGYQNFYPSDPGAFGIFMQRCSRLSEAEHRPLVITACNQSTAPERTFVVEFVNHLTATDVDQLIIIPATAGSITTLLQGTTELKILERKGVPAKISLPGALGANLEKDIMYGGYNDVDGMLAFQKNISLELMKLALALDYTPEEVEAATRTYKAIAEQLERYGGDF